ncbi:MAG: hypothetical protein P8O97_04600 [Gammaproteobacteria bacterium]|nr:hypothetical protein [Gammaproteobacteria bacterium]
MKGLLDHGLRLITLRNTPADTPSSKVIQRNLLLAYILLALLSVASQFGLAQATVYALCDAAILFVFTKILLMKHPERIDQTFNAFLLAGVLIGAVQTLAMSLFINEQTDLTQAPLLSLGFMLLAFWLLLVFGHIVRHAINVKLSAGILISLGLLIVNSLAMITLASIVSV